MVEVVSVAPAVAPAFASAVLRSRQPVVVLAQQAFDLAPDRRFARLAVRPVDGQVSADAVDQLGGDRREPRVRSAVLEGDGLAAERVVEGRFLDAQPELLVAVAGVA